MMDFDDWWLLAIPLLFGMGWLARSIDANKRIKETSKLPSSYFKGLNHLLGGEPDKAIDALDEAGSRVHISNINVPERIVKLEEKIEKTKEEKIKAVKSQNFELAANHRDKEKSLIILWIT